MSKSLPKLNNLTFSPAERAILHKRQVAVRAALGPQRAALGPQMAHDAEWQHYTDMMTDRLVIQLRSYVYGDHLDTITKTATFTTPANWWQALRERVLDERGRLDRAILRRWPIRTRSETQTLTVERWATFPDNATVYPKNLGEVVYWQGEA